MTTQFTTLRIGTTVLLVLMALRFGPASLNEFKVFEQLRFEADSALRFGNELVVGRTLTAMRLRKQAAELNARSGEFLSTSANQQPNEALVALLAQYAEDCDVHFESISPATNDRNKRSAPSEVTVSADGHGNMASITGWLAAVESGEPRLYVKSLDLRPNRRNADEGVEIRVAIVGLARPGLGLVTARK